MKPNLVGCDIETNGKNPREPGKVMAVLELGLIVYSRQWRELRTFRAVVGYSPEALVEIIAAMDPNVVAMHTASGLIDRLQEQAEARKAGAKNSLADIEREAVRFIAENSGAGSPMFGSSVHFERKWFAVFMPTLDGIFHYRNLDASSLAEMARLDELKLSKAFAAKTSRHSTLEDIRDSAALARLAWGYGYGWRAVWHHVKAAWRALFI